MKRILLCLLLLPTVNATTIYIPDNDSPYITSGISLLSNTTLECESRYTEIRLNGTGAEISSANTNGITIINCFINASGADQNGVSFNNVSNFVIYHTSVYGATLKGIAIAASRNGHIEYPTINKSGQDGIAIATDVDTNTASTDITIDHPTVTHSGVYGIGIVTVTPGNATPERISITNFNIKYTGAYGIVASGCIACEISHGTINMSAMHGINLGANAPTMHFDYSTVIGNRVFNTPSSYQGIRMQHGSYSIVMGNVLHNASAIYENIGINVTYLSNNIS